MTAGQQPPGDDAVTGPVPTQRPVKHETHKHPAAARWLRVLAVPVVLFWVIAAAAVTIFVPSLEETTSANAKAMIPRDAPSSVAAITQGKDFKESDYTSAAVVVLEAQGRQLGEQDRKYYDEMVRRLRDDKEHVQSLMDMWGDPVTRSGQQSADGQVATLTVRPTGDLADADSNRSIKAIRGIIEKLDNEKPEGLKVYVSGPAPLASDMLTAADESMVTLEIVTVVVIIVMLLIAFRSVTRAIIPLFGVLITLATARGVISLLVENHVIGISSFGMNMAVSLVLGVATDYGIFYLGRFEEALRAGEDRESAYYTSVHNVTHVVIGSGVAISGACLCLSLTTLDYFRTLGPPCFVAMAVSVMAALTMGPALLTLGSKIPWLGEPAKASPVWRKLGTATAKWPAAMIAVAALVIPLCIANLANYTVSYNDRDYAPTSVEASQGYAAADRHFQPSQLSIDTLYIKADHDMRNTTDMISLDRIAKNIVRTPGISMVQSITRPNGRPLEHASLPYAMGSMGTKIGQNLGFMKDRVADIDTMAARMGDMIASTQKMTSLTGQLAEGTQISTEAAKGLKEAMETMRDKMADFDDFFRPVRNYLYWEPHCFDIPICWAMRSLNESLDSIDETTQYLGPMVDGLTKISTATPQMIAQLNAMVQNMTVMQRLTLTTQSLMHATITQLEPMVSPMVDMAQAFDNAKNDDFFFLPPDSFKTTEFQTGLKFMMTPDGRGTRIMIYHQGEAMSPEGIDQIQRADAAAHEAIKGTSLSDVQLLMAGSSSNFRDVQTFSMNDILTMMLATFGLVFLIVMVITRTLAGSVIVLITVVLSFLGSLGLAAFIWETLFGITLHWLTLPIAFIVLVGVGCDYNLLLLSRYREELSAGIRTGLIRTITGSGNVAVTAAFVLAGTMLAMLSSDVVNIGQAGATICIGLVFDMMIVRLLLVMPLASLLGPWFWWPQKLPTPRRATFRNEPSPGPQSISEVSPQA
ncbi:RND family transporter [Mycobacterium sp. D16Q16]|uniref:MMPL/RND family transporter n=1 Tax=Mycobacterium sp. D16Q16 TaxID=1855659 RepID=UPI0009924516|nr:RND family transporter [Mycobacterium sp. D16Q16]